MGTHTHVYVGAYLQVPTYKGTKDRKWFGCSKPDCTRYDIKSRDGSKFCIQCGSKLEPRIKVEEVILGYGDSDLSEEFEDKFFSPSSDHGIPDGGFDLLLANHTVDGTLNIGSYGSGVYEYNEETLTRVRDSFLQKYAEEIPRIMAEFPGTEVKTGVVVYYS